MHGRRILMSWTMLLAMMAALTSAQELMPSSLRELHSLITPQLGEAEWRSVDWMPSTNLWAARQRAAKEHKPLLLWYMAGEPLGTC